jgi:hypothetical protein
VSLAFSRLVEAQVSARFVSSIVTEGAVKHACAAAHLKIIVAVEAGY